MKSTTHTNPVIPGPQEQEIPTASNLFKALFLIAMLAASFALTQWGASLFATSPLPAWLAVTLEGIFLLAMAVWHGVLILGMGVLAHDAVHKSLFPSLFWNELCGGLLSAFALVPFYTNRQFHLTHHGYAHQSELDPEHIMHNHSLLYAGTVGSLIGLAFHYQLLMRNLWRSVHEQRYRARVGLDLVFLGVVMSLYFGFVPALGISVWLTVVPMIGVFPLVFAWRALSDHYAVPAIERSTHKKSEILDTDEEAWHRERERRQREISGWVVLTHPWLEWLWSHVNYHEVHHKYPWLSHRYLPLVFAATRATQPYLVVKGYWRSLFNLRRRGYYASRAEMRPFLSTPDW